MQAINPLNWMRWGGEFIRVWLMGLPWRDAPKAIPAIILTIVLFTVGFVAFSGEAGWRNQLLVKQYKVSMEREDYPTAEIVLKRQLEGDPENVNLLYEYALVRENQSFTEEATALMRGLVKKRHVRAATWLLVNEYIGKQWTDLDQEKKDEFGLVLSLINDEQPDNIPVTKMYAEYLIVTQRFASAVPLLESLSKIEPMRGLQAAALCRQIGDFEAAERYADQTLEVVEEMAKDDPTNSDLAMAVARNQIFLRRYSDAVRTLDLSVKRAKTPEHRQMLSQALGDAIVAWVKFIEESPSNTVTERLRVLKMLQAALRFAPNNPRVVTLIADHVLKSLDEDDEELASVRNALVNGSSVGIAHFIKGTSALMKKDMKNAQLHLELAVELMPRSGAILNNLAVALAMREDPDYERALELSGAAIELVKSPTPHFYETRGQIFFRMGELKKAIPDLERALAEPSLAKKAHEMLANCYDEVGDKELADNHRTAVERLEMIGQE